jgi:hypothetical protein
MTTIVKRLSDDLALTRPGDDITITYALGSNEWVALDSRLDNGRTLRYRRSPSELS